MEPEEILLENQKNLIHLDLSGNRLEWLSQQTLTNKTKLKTLILASNSLTKFPDNINSLESLEYLDLSDNNLKSTSNIIIQLNNLRVLKINDNIFKQIKDDLWDFPNLSSFFYSVNKESAIFPIDNALRKPMNGLRTVYMDASYEALTTQRNRYKSIGSLFLNLEDYEKSGKELTGDLTDMTNLKFLEIESDYYSSYHDEFQFIIDTNFNLETLSLNEWKGPTNTFDHLTSLKTLKMSNCAFSGNESLSFKNRNLTTIDILMTPFPPKNLKLFNKCAMLLTIKIFDCDLGDIHSDTFVEQTLLEELDLSKNGLKLLPDGIFRNLRNLKILVLVNNLIEVIPNFTFDNLNNLVELNLEGNNLMAFYA